ncbi:MAG: DUF937 domain-containing protein [Erysipelotrichaceae bacterium]|nr:DUF937 domain-containing protein [Erysipelotrichaceae bacterium]
MNLLQLLLGTLASNDSVSSVSKKTGVSSKSTSKLLMMAIPLLISYMTKNASKKQGAQSLLGALTQHTSQATVQEQVAKADEVDGAKIIAHILGQDQNTVLANLGKETGLTTAQVNSVLSNIAPALLNSLGTATNTAATAAKKKPAATTTASSGVNLMDGIDLSDILGLLGGSQSSTNTATNLLGSLLGTTTTTTSKKKKKADELDLTSMLGSLLTGTTNTQTSNQASDGTQLLSLLTSLMG